MKRLGLIVSVLALGILAAHAETDAETLVRLANGRTVPGQVLQVTDAGIEMQTSKGKKTFPWRALSAGTRFRFQPSYRANFSAVLRGEPLKSPSDGEKKPNASE